MNAAAIPSYRFCGLPPITSPEAIVSMTGVALLAIAGIGLGALVLSGQGAILGVAGVIGNKAAIAFVVIGGSTLLGEFCVTLYCCYKQKQLRDWVFDEEIVDSSEYEDFSKKASEEFHKIQSSLPAISLKERLPSPDKTAHYMKKHKEKYLFTPAYALGRAAKEKMEIQLDCAARKGF